MKTAIKTKVAKAKSSPNPKAKSAKAKSEIKLDLYSRHSKEYAASQTAALVAVGPATYLSISGQGAPGGAAFSEAIGALYGVAFTVKMTRKFAGKTDYAVCKLEGLWPGFKDGCLPADKDQWTWEMMIRTPEFVKDSDIKQAVAVLQKRGKGAGADRVRLTTFNEGLCVQALHVGPYDKEGETICKMNAFAESKGLKLSGVFHEIYLSDPRRVDPARLKTILRHPVAPVGS